MRKSSKVGFGDATNVRVKETHFRAWVNRDVGRHRALASLATHEAPEPGRDASAPGVNGSELIERDCLAQLVMLSLGVGAIHVHPGVLAFDPDQASIARARAALPPRLAGRVTYRVASASDIEIAPSSWDAVVFSGAL